MRLVTSALLGMLCAGPAAANDSTAELATGGLAYITTDAVEMRSEDLSISMDEVRVRYEFVNTSDHDVTTLVAFPMPDIKGDIDFMVAVPVDDPENFLGFQTTVDGSRSRRRCSSASRRSASTRRPCCKASACRSLRKARRRATRSTSCRRSEWDKLISLGLAAPEEYRLGQGMERHLAPVWLLSTAYLLGADVPRRQDRRSWSIATSRASARPPALFGYEGVENEPWVKDYFSRSTASTTPSWRA